jgi:ribosomal protein L7/L12
MKKANRYWAIRNKIKSGEWDNLEMLEVEEQIHEYLDQGSKINAIKYYRESMKTHFNRHVTLRESKDMIDALSIGKKATLW